MSIAMRARKPIDVLPLSEATRTPGPKAFGVLVCRVVQRHYSHTFTRGLASRSMMPAWKETGPEIQHILHLYCNGHVFGNRHAVVSQRSVTPGQAEMLSVDQPLSASHPHREPFRQDRVPYTVTPFTSFNQTFNDFKNISRAQNAVQVLDIMDHRAHGKSRLFSLRAKCPH